MLRFPLLIQFAAGSSIFREADLVSQLPIIRNGPAGTFVDFPDGLRVSLPTDQIVFSSDSSGAARVGFGGMSFAGEEDGQLIFNRVRDLLPEAQLSPARSWIMTLEPAWVSSILVDGSAVWPL